MAFLDDVLEWFQASERDHAYIYYPHEHCEGATSVVKVVTYSSDFADGSTESGFFGDTDITITWICKDGHRHETEIKPGDDMASLWKFMLNRWKEYAP